MNTEEQLRATVRDYANELEAIAAGELYDVDGEYVAIGDIDDWKADQHSKLCKQFLKDHAGEEFDRDLYDTREEWAADEVGDASDIEEPERVSIYDYMERHALSTKYWKIDSYGECVGGEVQLCCGGPNVWANEDGVFGAWGTDRTEWYSSEAGDAVLEYLKETMPSR